MRLAYIIADLLYLALYRIGRYRLKVVRKNLRDSFPEMTEKELRAVERQFYHNFSDTLVEAMCVPFISDKAMERRMVFDNVELMNRHIDAGRSIAVYFAHTFNWEWAPSVTLQLHGRGTGQMAFGQVYRPLKSRFFDSLMLRMRSRFGSESYPKSNTLRHLLRARSEGKISVTGFMSDQHPSHGDPGHLTTLLGHPTLMITGTETLASRLGMAAVFWDMEKLSRGHYRITVRPLADNAAGLPKGQLTEAYTRMLETTIRRNPAIWLWSHNRWKHPVNPTTIDHHQEPA